VEKQGTMGQGKVDERERKSREPAKIDGMGWSTAHLGS
jgi:hypothetical protein